MSGIPHDDHYEPKTGFEKWLDARLPIAKLAYDTLMIPTPKNLNWMWIWGVVLTFTLVLQIATGIALVMHYTQHVDGAFASVEHIMRNVNGGWALRYTHARTAPRCSSSRSICTSSAASITAPTRRRARSPGSSAC
jgi:ubiquinol-cytochrome c reductase cytochrome b subunit